MKRRRWIHSLFAIALILIPVASQADSGFVILCGSGGEESYTKKFQGWGNQLRSAILEKLGYREGSVSLLTEPEAGKEPSPGSISLEAIRALFGGLSRTITTGDDLYIFLIGHGSYLRRECKFNIPGPDLSAAELKSLLDPIKARRMIIINSISSGAGFINELSAPNRIICTATKSVDEVNATIFMEFFVQGLHEGSADQNRDERISILEACRQASSLTEAWFLGQGITPTEHAILDDNGDGLGTRVLNLNETELAEGGPKSDPKIAPDGRQAAICFVKDFSFPPTVPRELVDKYLGLLNQIEQLKKDKANLPGELYAGKLEELLIQAARANREIHALIPPEGS